MAPSYQEDVLITCEYGDLSQLEKLFSQRNEMATYTNYDFCPVQKGFSKAMSVWDMLHDSVTSQDGFLLGFENTSLPPVDDMLSAAIIGDQVEIVEYLLQEFPNFDVHCGIAGLALQNPNIEIFKVLHARFPNIVNHCFYYNRTILTEALRAGSFHRPLVEYLIDHGALMDLVHHGKGTVYSALKTDQPLEIIEKCLAAGARLTPSSIENVIEHSRYDVLSMLFCNNRPTGGEMSDMELASVAHRSKDPQSIRLVMQYIRGRRFRSQTRDKSAVVRYCYTLLMHGGSCLHRLSAITAEKVGQVHVANRFSMLRRSVQPKITPNMIRKVGMA